MKNKKRQMNKDFKPIGYNSVSPYFIVNDAQRLIDLMKLIFNAKELRRYDMQDGSIMHAEIQIDDSVIMLGDSSDKFPPVPLVIHIYVPNVDEIFNKAIMQVVKSWKDQKNVMVTQTDEQLLKTLQVIYGRLERS